LICSRRESQRRRPPCAAFAASACGCTPRQHHRCPLWRDRGAKRRGPRAPRRPGPYGPRRPSGAISSPNHHIFWRRKRMSGFRMAKIEHPWTAPIRVEEIPDTGRRIELTANELVRTRVAEAAGVNGLTRLEAIFDLTRHGRSGLHVTGGISATVRQTCVVTLEPVVNEVA